MTEKICPHGHVIGNTEKVCARDGAAPVEQEEVKQENVAVDVDPNAPTTNAAQEEAPAEEAESTEADPAAEADQSDEADETSDEDSEDDTDEETEDSEDDEDSEGDESEEE